MDEVSVGEYLQQIVDVWRLKSDTSKINTININFMSRGEPLLNSNLYGEGFYDMVIEMFKGYHVNFNISSIIPKGIEALPSHPNIRFYYSLYSVNEAFRKKWLPKAMEPRDALKLIKTEAIIHGAFIEGENDSEEDVENMIKVIVDSGVKCRFNVVAYNPFSRKQGEESSRIKGIARQINERISVQKIPKVGFDVKASCGMFV
jgi:adenine C2-methylase RlmN of 23S rRNA A2503 and tRNA A37